MSLDEAQLVDAEIMKQREMLKQEWKALKWTDEFMIMFYDSIDLV